jgi:hypothetical protein
MIIVIRRAQDENELSCNSPTVFPAMRLVSLKNQTIAFFEIVSIF